VPRDDQQRALPAARFPGGLRRGYGHATVTVGGGGEGRQEGSPEKDLERLSTSTMIANATTNRTIAIALAYPIWL